jgi:transcription elongation factor SPT5
LYNLEHSSSLHISKMSNLLNTRFDDSEDEDEFNPAPADLSDAEDAGGSDHDEDAGAQIQNEAARRQELNDDDGSDEEPPVSKRRSSADSRGADEDEDEDAEVEGEDTAPGANEDEDEEDEEDDDEEEITVSSQNLF